MHTMTRTTVRTLPFSAHIWANTGADENDPRFDRLLDILIADPRGLGADSITTAHGTVASTFQVEVPHYPTPNLKAADVAVDIFDRALALAGFDVQTAGFSIVEGDDPEQLP